MVLTPSVNPEPAAREREREGGSHRQAGLELGFVVIRKNSLRTAVHPSDHLESLLFLAHFL
jgi:hypothetical protein